MIQRIPITDHTAGRISAPGFYRMATDLYHGDPVERPSLSASIASLMVRPGGAPIRAKLAHPRLTEIPFDRDPSRTLEIGTAAHKLILGHGAEIVAIDAADYKTGDARRQRAAAYETGFAPILKADLATAEALERAVAQQILRETGNTGFFHAPAEVVAICQDETGAWLRSMIDRLEVRGDRAIVWDVKTGDQPAAAPGLGRRIAGMGYEVQAAFYERVIARLRPELDGRITFRWIFVENEAPHLLQVAELDATGIEIGRRKVAAAIALWNRSLAADDWPGYPPGIVVAEYPSYAEAAWTWRETEDPLLANLPPDPIRNRPIAREQVDYLRAG